MRRGKRSKILLALDEQRLQGLSIEHVKIRKLSGIHGYSML
jgi:hypothetical protein